MKPLSPLEAVQLITLHCEYCSRMRTKPTSGLRKRLDSIHRRMFTAMTGEKPNDTQMKWMQFS